MRTGFLILLFVISAASELVRAEDRLTIQQTFKNAVALFNQQRYSESLKVLNTIQSVKSTYPIWHYYVGANLTYAQSPRSAIANLEEFNKKSVVNSSLAKSYYYIGLNYFNLKKFESALNKLELAFDLSNNKKLDATIEQQIEKTIRYQNYYETAKKNNLTLLLGYSYDSNRIDQSEKIFTQKLVGHSLNYGLIYSHRLVDEYTTLMQPSITLLDSYTLDNSFKSNEVIQLNDAFQVLAALPLAITNENSPNETYNFSFNFLGIYLPLTDKSRELAFTSFYILGGFSHRPFSSTVLQYQLQLAKDKSENITDADDDASGTRYKIDLSALSYFFKNERSFGYGLSYESTNANGHDARFDKYSGFLAYNFNGFWETSSKLELDYHNIKYPLRFIPRTDNVFSLSYSATKLLEKNQAIGFSLTATQNQSNIESNKYNDYVFGLNYSKGFSF